MVIYIRNLLYLAAYAIAGPLLLARGLRRGTLGLAWRQRIFGSGLQSPPSSGCIWLHAVSVGEVQLLAPLIRSLQVTHPDRQLVISSTTAGGLQAAEKAYPSLYRFRAPIDYSWAVRRVIASLQPSLILLSELELWPNWVAIAAQQQIPIAVVNGRLSSRSHLAYQRAKSLLRGTFQRLSLIAAQDEATAQRFVSLGVDADKVIVTGNIKFDAAVSPANGELLMALRKDLRLQDNDNPVWVCGSTQESEEDDILKAARRVWQIQPRLRLIWVPRQPERFGPVVQACRASGYATIRLSQLDSADKAQSPRDWQVAVGDTIGQLSTIWHLADVAFVGGSFGDRGGQNMIEPIAAGALTAVGNNTRNFAAAMRTLTNAGVVSTLTSPDQLADWVIGACERTPANRLRSQRGMQVVASHAGSVERIIRELRSRRLLDAPNSAAAA